VETVVRVNRVDLLAQPIEEEAVVVPLTQIAEIQQQVMVAQAL
jgi:hypothetical protein